MAQMQWLLLARIFPRRAARPDAASVNGPEITGQIVLK